MKLRRILGFCGACIAFYIGAGFATMQEVMQYDVSYGSAFPVVIAVSALIYLYTNWSFARNGARYSLSRGSEIYRIYTGKWIGAFFDIFSAVFCYMCFIVMCGGANATASQQWGLPNGVGAAVLTVCVIATAVFGLKGILNTLGKIGPVIIGLILVVSVWTLCTGLGSFRENLAAIDEGVYEIKQVGSSPFASGASYGGFVILWFAAFLSEIGAKNKLKEVHTGMVLSCVFIFAAAALCCMALICKIGGTAAAEIPALVLADAIHPVFSQIFAVIIFCGIYTTAVPLLWTGIGRLAQEGSTRYRVLIAAGGIIGCAAACLLPYMKLVNILYGLNGYLGFILVAFMIVHDIRTAFRERSVQS